jgi:hypothetical protein
MPASVQEEIDHQDVDTIRGAVALSKTILQVQLIDPPTTARCQNNTGGGSFLLELAPRCRCSIAKCHWHVSPPQRTKKQLHAARSIGEGTVGRPSCPSWRQWQPRWWCHYYLNTLAKIRAVLDLASHMRTITWAFCV